MKARRDLLFKRRLLQQVSGQLLDRELIERQVAINRVNDPLAKYPGMRPQTVSQITLAVGIPGEVQPVPPPTLAVMGRIQQLINQPFVRLRFQVRDELFHGIRCRRKPREVQIQTPNQRATICLSSRP